MLVLYTIYILLFVLCVYVLIVVDPLALGKLMFLIEHTQKKPTTKKINIFIAHFQVVTNYFKLFSIYL